MEARSKQGEDIQSTDDDTLVVTIVITTHGCVTTMDVEPNNYNIRYRSAIGDKLEPHAQSKLEEIILLSLYNNSFRKDKPGGDDTERPIRLSYFDSLPYDKVLSVNSPHPSLTERMCNFGNRFSPSITGIPGIPLGIWLVSVHKKLEPQIKRDYKYVYPEDKTQYINLLNLVGLENFNQFFNKIPDLKSTLIRENNKHFKLNDDNTRIESIRLSYLLDLFKEIIGTKCEFNIYDYSCSNMCDGSTGTKTTTSMITNIEEGKMPFFTGGKRKNRKTKRRRSRNKKNKKSRKRRR
jgi:hypothetical protein